uniref:Tripartite motif-containing protein 54 n=1 Tax=Eptatretus burgeri TaxID=7764 RepID=A0A8C4QGP4_EPTBU
MSTSQVRSMLRSTDQLETLERQLLCPICLEIFTKPVVILPCQHNLCRKCASDIFEASNPYYTSRSGMLPSGGRFRCPSCRHEVVLDRHGVYGLQRNLLVENIIDIYKEEAMRPIKKLDQPMCPEHGEEKINIYCVSCRVPTCSLCKVFGEHKDCQVEPLCNIYTGQKTELNEQVAGLVACNDRRQALISQLEKLCSVIEENGREQQNVINERFDGLLAALEERRRVLLRTVCREQEGRIRRIRDMVSRHSVALHNTSHLVQVALQSIDEPEMAVFLQSSGPLFDRITEACEGEDLEAPEPGYENMDHFSADLEEAEEAIRSITFTSDIEVEEDPEENFNGYDEEQLFNESGEDHSDASEERFQ